MADPIQLVPNRPDAELAAEFKDEIVKAAEPLLVVLEKINKSGFQANIGFSMSPIGKMTLNLLQISKVY